MYTNHQTMWFPLVRPISSVFSYSGLWFNATLSPLWEASVFTKIWQHQFQTTSLSQLNKNQLRTFCKMRRICANISSKLSKSILKTVSTSEQVLNNRCGSIYLLLIQDPILNSPLAKSIFKTGSNSPKVLKHRFKVEIILSFIQEPFFNSPLAKSIFRTGSISSQVLKHRF